MILILPRIFKIANFVDAWTEKEPDLFFPFAAALLEARSKHGNYYDGGAPSANMVGLIAMDSAPLLRRDGTRRYMDALRIPAAETRSSFRLAAMFDLPFCPPMTAPQLRSLSLKLCCMDGLLTRRHPQSNDDTALL